MKKIYQAPVTQDVELLTNASFMNVVPSSTTNAGTGTGEATDKDPECAGVGRGEWGNVWGK